MGYVYEDGKEYPRAGVYRRSSNGNVNNTVASALDGIGVLPIKSDWGPLNEVTIHEIGTSDEKYIWHRRYNECGRGLYGWRLR